MRAAAALLLLIGVLGAASAADAPTQTRKILRKGNGPDVETLDPHKARSVSAGNVLRDLFEGLITEAPDGALIGGAARDWEVGDGGRLYVFHLRPELRWSNGDALTAEDFVWSLRRSVDPATGSASAQLLAPIENADAVMRGERPASALGVEAADGQTLLIRLRAPTPYFLGLLAQSAAYPVHRASVERLGASFTRAGALVGNGAYRLADWRLQAQLRLQRNPHYWNDAHTRIDEVLHIVTEDVNSELQRFRAGELDWTEQLPPGAMTTLSPALRAQLQIAPYLGLYYYGLNLTQPPLAGNAALRRALSLALDRDIVTQKLLASGETPAYGWVPPGVAGYDGAQPEWAGWPRERRLEEARRLFREAGYSDERPLTLELRYNTHDQHRRIATVVGAMWKQFLGVRTTLINEESKVFLQTRRTRRTQVFRASWIGDYNDPLSFLELLHSRNGRNDTGYADAGYDALLDRAAIEPDAGRRAALLREAEARMLEQVPVIPLYAYVSKRLVSPRVIGWRSNILDHHYTRSMDLVGQ